MRKKAIVRFLILIVILGGLYAAYLYFTRNDFRGGNFAPVKHLTKEEARVIAADNLDYFETWRKNQVSEVYEFKDLKDITSAYMFDVQDYQGKAGYILISATNKLPPVLDVSKNTQTPVVLGYKLMTDIANETIWTVGDIRATFMYFGGNDYYVKLVARDGDEVVTMYYQLKPDESVEVTLEQIEAKYDQYVQMFQDEVSSEWAKYLK